VYFKTPEINVRTISFPNINTSFSDPILVVLSAFFLSETQVVCDFNAGLTWIGSILCYPC
jgi:hypothetical protein